MKRVIYGTFASLLNADSCEEIDMDKSKGSLTWKFGVFNNVAIPWQFLTFSSPHT